MGSNPTPSAPSFHRVSVLYRLRDIAARRTIALPGYTTRLDFADIDSATATLHDTNAFEDAESGALIRMPGRT